MDRSQVPAGENSPSRPNRPSKLPVFLIIAVLIAAAAGGIFMLIRNAAGPSAPHAAPEELPALLRELSPNNGADLYIPLHDGTCVYPEAGIQQAYVTGDEAHVVMCDDKGQLLLSDKSLSVRTILTKDAKYITFVTDTGVAYFTTDGHLHRYLFAQGTDLDLGRILNCIHSQVQTDLSLLYSTAEGVFILPEEQSSPVMVGENPEGTTLLSLSPMGQQALWLTGDSVNLYDGIGTEVLCTASLPGAVKVVFSKDGQLTAVLAKESNTLYLKKAGEAPKSILLEKPTGVLNCWTQDGPVSLAEGAGLTTLYITQGASSDSSLYRISEDGTQEEVLAHGTRFHIYDRHLLYTDGAGNMYAAVLSGNSVKKEERIAKNVDDFYVTSSRQYVYYLENVLRDKGSLNCWKLGAKKPMAVDTQVSRNVWSTLRTSPKGDVLFYGKNCREDTDSYSLIGDLMVWNYAEEAPTALAVNAIFSPRLPVATVGTQGVNPQGLLYAVREDAQFRFFRWDGSSSVPAGKQ